MITISSEVIINSLPTNVWRVLCDFALYPNWNPFITSIKGNIGLNNKIEVIVKPVGSREMKFKPTILTYSNNEEITWEGNLFIKGVFDGRHSFRLIDNSNGTTTFIQTESFSGLLVPLFRDMIENKTLKGFYLMNQKLKEIMEE